MTSIITGDSVMDRFYVRICCVLCHKVDHAQQAALLPCDVEVAVHLRRMVADILRDGLQDQSITDQDSASRALQCLQNGTGTWLEWPYVTCSLVR